MNTPVFLFMVGALFEKAESLAVLAGKAIHDFLFRPHDLRLPGPSNQRTLPKMHAGWQKVGVGGVGGGAWVQILPLLSVFLGILAQLFSVQIQWSS